MRKFAAVILALALIASAGAQDKVIKIGTLFPMTGPVATAGQRCQAAVETIVDIINGVYPDLDLPIAKKAGLLDGYRIELVKADHQGKPDVAKSEAERLYGQEGVFAVIGSYNSSASKPASAVAERLQKIFMCGASSSAALTERDLKYFFRLAPTDRIEAIEFVHWFDELNKSKKAGIKTVGVIYNAGESNSVFLIDAEKEAASALGLEIVEATASNSSEVQAAAESLVGRVDAISVLTDNTAVSALESIIKVGEQNGIPVIAGDTDSVKRGAVAAYAFDYEDLGKQAGYQAAAILMGTPIKDIPVEYAENLQLSINEEAASRMGVTIPADLKEQAQNAF